MNRNINTIFFISFWILSSCNFSNENKMKMKELDDLIDLFSQNLDQRKQILLSRKKSIKDYSKQLIKKLGDQESILKIEDKDFKLLSENNITTSKEYQERIANSYKVFVSRDVSKKNNTKLILGCGKGALRRISYQNNRDKYKLKHMHNDEDTIDFDPGMNPDITANLLNPCFANYLNSIGKFYDIIQPESLDYIVFYNYELIKNIRNILSKKGNFIISKSDALQIFLSKFSDEYKYNELSNGLLSPNKIRTLINKIYKNKLYTGLSKKLGEILNSWKKELIELKKEYITEHDNIILLFRDYLTQELQDYFLENSEICVGISIKYRKDKKYNYKNSSNFELLEPKE